jgi:hypothetical protein
MAVAILTAVAGAYCIAIDAIHYHYALKRFNACTTLCSSTPVSGPGECVRLCSGGPLTPTTSPFAFWLPIWIIGVVGFAYLQIRVYFLQKQGTPPVDGWPKST